MTIRRRDLLAGVAAVVVPLGTASASDVVSLQFPRDFGAHAAQRTEWWYLTGDLRAGTRRFGFQITFFRTRTGLAAADPSRFAARELVFAHAALTDVDAGRLRHDQRIARSGFGVAAAAGSDTDVVLQGWRMTRAETGTGSRYHAVMASDTAAFALDLVAEASQPVLLQGEAGLSRKGPDPKQTSRYYSEPQLRVQGRLQRDGKPFVVTGRAWLDHEWSDAFLDPAAVGWDWTGMNLDDGRALTAFRLRRADGTALYAGGSMRAPGGALRTFGPGEVAFVPGRVWESAASRARYPVDWTIETPAGRFRILALLDDQELDSRGSTGSIYWEGLSDLLDAGGRRVGSGYLEMTGYAAALRL